MFNIFSFAVDLHVQHVQWKFFQSIKNSAMLNLFDIPYLRYVNNTICLTMLLPLVNKARRFILARWRPQQLSYSKWIFVVVCNSFSLSTPSKACPNGR